MIVNDNDDCRVDYQTNRTLHQRIIPHFAMSSSSSSELESIPYGMVDVMVDVIYREWEQYKQPTRAIYRTMLTVHPRDRFVTFYTPVHYHDDGQ